MPEEVAIVQGRRQLVSEREAAVMSADELVARTYELVRLVDDDAISSELYMVLTEAFERWAPEAEWRDMVNHYNASEPNELNRRFEIEGTRQGKARRAQLRIDALRVETGRAS